MFGSYSALPGGNIHPSRFVKKQSDQTVVEAGAGDAPWGISQPSTRYAAWSAVDDGFAGVSGDPAINIFGPGDDQCPLELGGTVSAGDALKASTNGVGITAGSDADKVGAIALRSGVSGDVIPVKPMRYDRGS